MSNLLATSEAYDRIMWPPSGDGDAKLLCMYT